MVLKVVKILPGRASRRTEDDQSYGSSIHRTEIHAYRWNHATNVKEYLAYDKILACGGSWMVKGSLVEAGEFDKIEDNDKRSCRDCKRSKRLVL